MFSLYVKPKKIIIPSREHFKTHGEKDVFIFKINYSGKLFNRDGTKLQSRYFRYCSWTAREITLVKLYICVVSNVHVAGYRVPDTPTVH